MSFSNLEEQLSDDEVFFGKMSLKEIKKRVLGVALHQNQTMPYANNISNDHDESVKIIETHSEPDLLYTKTLSSQTECLSDPNLLLNSPQIEKNWDVKVSDDSFLQMEKMMSDSCSLSENNKGEELDNTLEVIEYILNNGPNANKNEKDDVNGIKEEKIFNKVKEQINAKTFHELPKLTQNDNLISHWHKSDEHANTPLKEINKKEVKPNLTETPNKTDSKPIKTDIFNTPNSNMKTSVFKTPANVLSHKKPSAVSLKKTPSRNNAYQHIASPVASYIKNGPQVPLLKDVRPKKPLPGPSSIPKLVKSSSQCKPSNKENINLPSIAYRSAKNTKVINIPDEDRLPQSQWAKKITSSLPKPLVMKHDHREMNFAKKRLLSQQEDSFADLSLHQAEVSVCTQKSAFTKS